MRFLIKMFVWCFLALLVLPSVAPNYLTQDDKTVHDSNGALSSQAVSLAVGVASDMRTICQREPDLCEKGSTVFSAALERATEGVNIALAMFENYRRKRENTPDTETTASVK